MPRAPNPKGSSTADARVLYSAPDYERPTNKDEQRIPSERYRTEFRRDFQRLVHSPAVRRLQGKTQLFPSGENDFYRNRLTHSIEVAQVAKSITIRCNHQNRFLRRKNINTDLVEFAGLAHDIGHPPFGHNGEYVLDEIMLGHGGFEGNAQTLRIISRLEKRVTEESPPTRGFIPKTATARAADIRRGLNVTYRALGSIFKYDRMIPRTEEERKRTKCHDEPCKGYYADEDDLVSDLKAKLSNGHTGRFKTIECSIMDVADDITYSTYDLEDAFVGGLLSPLAILSATDVVKQGIAERIQVKIDREFSDLPSSERQFGIEDMNSALVQVFGTILELDIAKIAGRDWRHEELATYVGGQVYTASQRLAKSTYHRTKFTSDLIGHLINNVEVVEGASENPAFWQVRPKIGAFVAIETLKAICFVVLTTSDKFVAERRRAKHIIKRIFSALMESGGDVLPPDWRDIYDFYRDDENGKRRAVCDFTSGMTNRYCLEFYSRLFGPEPPSIHKP